MKDEHRRFRFSRAARISGERAFESVFAARVRRGIGPFVFYGRRNGLEHSRLGLSIGRRVGNAVARNGIKRLLREAFRLDAEQLPRGMDLVVVVKPHSDRAPTSSLEAVRAALLEGARSLDRALLRRAEGAPASPSPASSSSSSAASSAASSGANSAKSSDEEGRRS